jgi:S1-C subfamily serine protease
MDQHRASSSAQETPPSGLRTLFLYPLAFGLLLGLGFFVGLAWNNGGAEGSATPVSGPTIETPPAASPASTQAQAASGPRQAADRADLWLNEQVTIDLFQQASPSVVFITSISESFDLWRMNVTRYPSGNGSGFIWDESGHIVTNLHVIQQGRQWQVTLADQSTWDAEVVGYAADKDLAVLKIGAPADRLTPIRVGNSSDLQVGQSVLAIGNPFGLDHTLTTGVISALGREIDSSVEVPIRDVIQTDAAINPGNSGGPLLDSSGRLIGVNTAIYSPSGAYAGIGFAIPIDTVNWVVADLIAYGQVRRPDLGLQAFPTYQAQRLGIQGVIVRAVDDGGPAEAAGLRGTVRDNRGRIRLGDVIVALDGEPIASAGDLQLALESREIGQEVEVTYMRGNESRTARLRLVSSTAR